MVKSNVKVYVRTRPTASNYEGLKLGQDGCSVTVKLQKPEELINNQQDTFSFKFDGVLENSSQETVYNTAASEVVDTVLAGYSGCVFTYGQTGAGKTFTMAGDLRNYTHRGIIPRAIHQVFREIDMRVDKLYKVQVSYLEIYNEQMYDLLAADPGSSEALAVVEDAVQGTFVRGLTRVPVGSEEEALSQYFVGEQGRSTARHVLNAQSSRSHCVFSLHVEMRTSEAASERAVLSRLHMVDLAGSERTKKTNASGQTLKEAQFINKSLSFLEQTVGALARKEAHVPFRTSRLTSVLRDALGGNCKTVMIANIWGEPQHVEETLSTLRFASRVRSLTTDLHMAESNDPGLLLKKYERQIKELKQELAMRDALSGKSRVNYDDLNDADIRDLHALARRFLQGEAEVEDLPSDSLKRVRETYKQLRAAHQGSTSELQAKLSNAQAGAAAAAAHAAQAAGDAPGSAGGGVGDVDREGGGGFHVGIAPAGARPTRGMSPPGALGVPASPSGGLGGAAQQPASPAAGSAYGGGGGGFADSPAAGGLGGAVDLGATVSVPGGAERNALFARFKHETGDGRALNGVVKERAAALKDLKVQAKASAEAVNAAKASIDALSGALGGRVAAEAPAEGVLDAEKYKLLQQLKAAKAAYRSEFDRLKDLRAALDPLSLSLAEAKQQLISEFDAWAGAGGSGMGPGAYGAGGGDEGEELDAGEAFERMQIGRMAAADPDSAAYHTALKRTVGRPGAPARGAGAFGGVKGQADAVRKMEREALINAGLAR